MVYTRKTWWQYTDNNSLSAEFGLPSCIPQDALDMEELHAADLPANFSSAIRITLESVKISKLVDLKTSSNLSVDKSTAHFGLLKMLGTNLDVLANTLKIEDAQPSCVTEFSLLMAQLNLCSFGLNQATKLMTPEATQLRLLSFRYATRLINLFVVTPFIAIQAEGTTATSGRPIQTYYPRAYWRGLGYACLALVKLCLTKTIPKLEIIQSENAIHQAVHLMSACSMVEGDELHREAKMIRFLRHEAVQEMIVQPLHEVKSRMGASLMYEMILSALVWKKRKSPEKFAESTNRPPQENNRVGESALRINATSSASGLPMSQISPGTIDEWITSSGYLLDGMGPKGFDASVWDTSMFDQVSLTADTIFLHVLKMSSCLNSTI
jgi:hypothetical protein